MPCSPSRLDTPVDTVSLLEGDGPMRAAEDKPTWLRLICMSKHN
jgi:hypothetical protein